MSIFDMHRLVVDEYARYVQSFLSIADERVRAFIDENVLANNALWPDALLQLNPAYEMAATVEDLVVQGRLHPACADVFRASDGRSIRLYRHQQDAIDRALDRDHFVVTSGTGSGKSLTYFVPIFDAILRAEPTRSRVRAIVVYPMNALVNSQYEALLRLAEQYERRTGSSLGVQFSRYTGQERGELRTALQQNPPHILLTNYVMLELMLVRPEEHTFVDHTTTGLQFLVVDELHTYRGRQGADVAMLVRRLRERCGNPNLLRIGTSATMVAGQASTSLERREAVAEFASKLFGVLLQPDNVVEESIRPITPSMVAPSPDQLRSSLREPLPDGLQAMLASPLTKWIELTFGIEEEPDGRLRRRTPVSLKDGAARLADPTALDSQACEDRLREMLLLGSQMRLPDGNPLFAFKLHQFIAQGRTIHATVEPVSRRHLTLDGQYYARRSEDDDADQLLYPLRFCRVCGQDYYAVVRNDAEGRLTPQDPNADALSQDGDVAGYIMVPQDGAENEWSSDHLPAEWLEQNGRVKRDYRQHVPSEMWVLPDGSFSQQEGSTGVKAWFQPRPFMLCLNCGEFYTRRDKNDFRKLTGLSSEGRSTATTVLSVSALRHAAAGGMAGVSRKVLSFTDNRQDASLQAGHFNDFVQVSLLRAAIYAALERRQALRSHDIAASVVPMLGLSLRDVALNRDLQPDTAAAAEVWEAFRDLVEYRMYEDLRRGWRVIQPNLEQCGLLEIGYVGLDELCDDDASWNDLPPFQTLPPRRRREMMRAVLDHFRRKLAIDAEPLREQWQQQMRRRVQGRINAQWGFDESEGLRTASRFILPGQSGRSSDGLSLADNSLIGRYLRRSLDLNGPYRDLVPRLIHLLSSHGLVRRGSERGVDFVQLEAAAIVWTRGGGTPPSPDPIYSRRATGLAYADVQRRANEFFRDFYQRAASSLRGIEGREHTAQVKYVDREQREHRFRDGDLACLFCSPTMELGIDIADLQLVHLRNVPPTPANYAQRSGRAGRKGDPALVLTYCSAGSGHDQYFFRHREDVVAGAVRPPRIDLSNEDLIKAHLRSIWLARVRLSLGRSVMEILELSLAGYPLKTNVAGQIRLPEQRFQECLVDARAVLGACQLDADRDGWFSDDWLENVLRRSPEDFDRAFDRWRQLYLAATAQLSEAQQLLARSFDRDRQREAQRSVDEAVRQRNLLCNVETTAEESDFYPYRYLASEGFLPGYNFPRLPVRAFVPRNDGEYIARPRFLAISEFGPQNVIYHEGTKYQAGRLVAPPGGLQARRTQAKLCKSCGYFLLDATIDRCESCDTRLDGENTQVVGLLEMSNVRTWRRERITCDEEERLRQGYDLSDHFRFAPGAGGDRRTVEATAYDANEAPVVRLVYAPASSLYRINHGWRHRSERGFVLDLANGEWLSRPDQDEHEQGPPSPRQPDVVRLFVQDTANLLLLYFSDQRVLHDQSLHASLQYALQRGIEQVFQIEESELTSGRVVSPGPHSSITFWEASEGGVGVLRRLVEDRDALAYVAQAALARCHFDPASPEDNNPDCARACYQCLLSYANQRDHFRLNRHLVRDVLVQLSRSAVHERLAGRDYDEHYRWLRSLTDSRSDIERRFVDALYRSRRRLPDAAQRPLSDYLCVPDFYYEPNVCVFCDGSVHDEPQQSESDRRVRQELRDRGYRTVVIRYDRDLEEQIRGYPDIFGEGMA